MRRHLTLMLALPTLISFQACSPGEEGQPPEATTATAVHATIVIGVDDAGNVYVSQDRLEVRNRNQSPVIAWAADSSLGDRRWIVGFAGASPFKSNRVAFSSDPGAHQGPISPDAAEGEYKYWVWVSAPGDAWLSLDPKIVIIDDPGQ
ncbi:MAG: hypothetical protein OEZ65_05685 [Gemmatimonadota bacterium]|nr:hypothetical protein [Gemmatimonadota bacterium]